MKIALLGGSFNPPHVGHLMAAWWTLATHPVDRVWLMPAFNHPFRKALIDFDHRVRMCELAAQDIPRIEVTRVEEEVHGEGWTYETLEHLRRVRPDIEPSLVVGSDLMIERAHWKRFDRILELCELIVVNRAGYPVPEAMGPILAEVSSTEVRQRIESGRDAREWVPRAVLDYIEAHRLYPSRSPPG
jgi:nicotinate-nucleotide adenylyltransferase